MLESFLHYVLPFLVAAMLVVPISHALGFGSVLGYLFAGILIGPQALGLVGHEDELMELGELGVIFLLFVIGLELNATRLWKLRKQIVGLGLAQMVLTGVLLAIPLHVVFNFPAVAALVVGLVFALSSTAFALQTLAERNELTTRHGRAAFSILLFQDLAVIPLLALIPLLGIGAASTDWLAAVRAVLIVIVFLTTGRWVLRQLLRLVARAGVHELFTAAALLVVLATAVLFESVGLSMALGAFLAGVLLADSEYRHELESDIEPFKGLLLGLFFITVGMALDLGLIAADPFLLIALTALLMSIKTLVLAAVARVQGLTIGTAMRLASILSQGGEFAFVLLSVAAGAALISSVQLDVAFVVVALSMALTPPFYELVTRLTRQKDAPAEAVEADPIEEGGSIIIAGLGRFGQIPARLLAMQLLPLAMLENDAEQVELVRRFGNEVYFGDATRLELLRSAGAEQAKAFVLAISDVEESLEIARTVRRHFPNLPIYARARDRRHAFALLDLDVRLVIRETFFSALELTREVLQDLGYSRAAADRLVRTFRAHDEELLARQAQLGDNEQAIIQSARDARIELRALLTADLGETESATPPKQERNQVQ